MKKKISLLLTVVLSLSLTIPTFAAVPSLVSVTPAQPNTAVQQAQTAAIQQTQAATLTALQQQLQAVVTQQTLLQQQAQTPEIQQLLVQLQAQAVAIQQCQQILSAGQAQAALATVPATVMTPAVSKEVSTVQEKLKLYGFYNGNITGILDASTQQAIKTYQLSYGIPADGTINQHINFLLGL